MKIRPIRPILIGICATILVTSSYTLIGAHKNESPSTTANEKASYPISIPPLDVKPKLVQKHPETNVWVTHQIKSGETLSTIFSKYGLSQTTLHEIIHSGALAQKLKSIRPGKIIKAHISQNGELKKLLYVPNRIETIAISHTDTGYEAEKIIKELNREIAYADGTIHSSLFVDGKNAGLSDKLIMQFANLFAWDIDFAISLRKGDQFSILYEKLFLDGDEINTGAILAAEFINQGKSFKVVRYTDIKNRIDHYSPDGKSVRKAFLRSPIEFARISSRFNLRRKHPILNRIRAHKGVDYAASTGTPIRTTGDGKIIFRGRKGGYGRAVVVQHGQRYSTLYAHLSRYSSKRKSGSRVKQGQVIGYVGKSGLATGPHLHYEFRVNGVHRNPLTVRLPGAAPIKAKYLADFKNKTTPLLSQLENYSRIRLAKTD